MKVLYILSTTEMGGATLSFINMIEGLHSRGVTAYIIYPDKEIDKEFYKRTKKIVEEFYQINMHMSVRNRSSDVRTIIKNLLKDVFRLNEYWLKRESTEIENVIRKVHPNIVHTNVGVIHSAYFAARAMGVPHLWHIREYQTKDFDWNIYPSKEAFEAYLRDGYVVTITRDLLHHFNLDGYSMARCIYNGCFHEDDTSFVYPKEKYFLCCSRLSQEKNIDEAILSFREFCEDIDGYRLIIAGFGEDGYVRKLKKLAEGSNVEFIGFQKDVRTLMENATAIIVPSHFEGFGRMTAEAAFMGCVVIGRNAGGTKEILEEIGGFPYLDGELVDRLKEVASLPDNEYRRITNRAQAKSTELFSIENNVCKIYEMYSEIVMGGHIWT